MSAPHAIKRGLRYIAQHQQKDGSFTSDSSPTLTPWEAQFQYHTTFVPALMLASLSHVADATLIRKKLASFLVAQKSSGWSFNYWAVKAPERKTFPYPDDLDDTFCTLIGLQLHDPSLVNEKALASMVKILLATEQTVGGPYRTWLVPTAEKAIWQDVDLAVNANIACFVSLVSNPLPNLQAYMEQHIIDGEFTSPYYPSPYPLWYYLARAYTGPKLNLLQQTIEQHWRQDKNPTALNTALALSALVQIAPSSKVLVRMARQLLDSQHADGSWPAAAFCIDPTRRKQQYYHGSTTLTTALAVEALARFDATQSPYIVRPTRRDTDATQLQKIITKHATRQLTTLGSSVRPQMQAMLTHMTSGDPQHEITLLPYICAQTLASPMSLSGNEQLFTNLGLANLYGWIAYTIYDDFLDDEGKPIQLSAANIALRSSLLQFQKAMPLEAAFQSLVEETFTVIDNANTWEIIHCRFKVTQKSIALGSLPRFGQRSKLAERSLGHGLTPLAVLVAQGISLDDPSLQAIDQAFRQYLIARQLNDDAHDWKEDVQKGHITYVVATILKELGVTGEPSFAKLLPAMEHQFWHHTLQHICTDMQTHVRRGKKLLADNPYLAKHNLLMDLLEKTEKSIQNTLKTQKQTLHFLQNYRGKKTNY